MGFEVRVRVGVMVGTGVRIRVELGSEFILHSLIVTTIRKGN